MNTNGHYLILSTRKPRGFAVLDPSGAELGRLAQTSWFRQDAKGVVDGHAVEVTPEGFWKNRYAIRVDGAPFGTIANKHWGCLSLTLLNEHRQPVELKFGRLSFWKGCFALRLDKDLILLEVKPRFNWQRFDTDFEVSLRGTGIASAQLPLLVALSGYCARLVRQRQSSAAAAG